jgi:putative ABC transport system substrate-binding protein
MKMLMTALIAIFAVLPVSYAQEKSRIPRIAYLTFADSVSPTFANKLHEYGYVDGQTASFEYRFAKGQHNRLIPLAQELVSTRPDVIFAFGDEAIAAAQIATKAIPIIMFACDAVTTGFVADLARPGGNTTGVTCITAELSAKRVAIFREMLPSLKRLAVFYNPENKSKPIDFSQTRDAAKSLGIGVDGFEVREPADIERVFASFATNRPDGVAVLDEAFTIFQAKRIVELTDRYRLPSMHSFREPVDAGGLMSYGPSISEMVATAADLIPKILNGAKPADLPVQQPTKFELVINLKTAKALGLAVQQSLLARADEVIE